MIRAANPGRWARVVSPRFMFEVDRVSPTLLQLKLGDNLGDLDPVTASEEEAEAMMRAIAEVLGYEIGPRHDL